MADRSPIEWTEATWNPVVGCSIVSPGCTNCYAMGIAARIEAMNAGNRALGKPAGAPHYDGTTKRVKGIPVWTGKLALAPEAVLTQPLRWQRPRRIFVNSMSDLFHENVPDAWIDRVFAVMALSPQHTFQVLTKRSARMREYLSQQEQHQLERGGGEDRFAVQTRILLAAITEAQRHRPLDDAATWARQAAKSWPLPNVWLGVSAEDQTRADERVPDLLATPAAVRFVSAEPLLGPIDFTRIRRFAESSGLSREHLDATAGKVWTDQTGLPNPDPEWAYPGRPFIEGRGLDWIIVGGESGIDARPMHPDWARSIRDQCAAAGTAFFFKQWGEWAPWAQPGETWLFPDGGTRAVRAEEDWPEGAVPIAAIGKKRAGRLLDNREHSAFPQVPA